MRFATFSIVGSFVAILLLFSLWPDQDRLPLAPRSTAQEATLPTKMAQSDSVAARTAQTRRRLDDSIVDFDYDAVPFGDILKDLHDSHGIESYLDESSDLKSETPVTIKFSSIRLSMALDLLFGQYNSQYINRDGIVLIASTDRMAELGAEIRVYNCRDLAQKPISEIAFDPLTTKPEKEPTQASGGRDEAARHAIYSERAMDLAMLIKAVVSPRSWEEIGNSAVLFDGLLVVNNTAIVHEQVEQLLDQLRQAANAPQLPSNANAE